LSADYADGRRFKKDEIQNIYLTANEREWKRIFWKHEEHEVHEGYFLLNKIEPRMSEDQVVSDFRFWNRRIFFSHERHETHESGIIMIRRLRRLTQMNLCFTQWRGDAEK
jgi:hypothetical protein